MYKFNPSDISEKVGLEQNIFGTGTQRKEVKEKDKRSKTSKVKHTIFQYFDISKNNINREIFDFRTRNRFNRKLKQYKKQVNQLL